MGFIDVIKERARNNKKTIVLPETEDKRTLAATEKILKDLRSYRTDLKRRYCERSSGRQ